MNSYDQSRQEAWNRMLRQLEMRQRYVDRQQSEMEAAKQKELADQKLAEPGSREVDWAGKGLAAGGLWGALAGATGARTVNAYDASQHGSFGDRAKGVLSAFFSPKDLYNAGKNKMTGQKEDALAGGMGREFGRNSATSMKDMDAMHAGGGEGGASPQAGATSGDVGSTNSFNTRFNFGSGNYEQAPPSDQVSEEEKNRRSLFGTGGLKYG